MTRYWNVAPWAPSYVAFLKVAHRTLNAADPGSKTILAGLPNESWKSLQAIYDAGARGHFDVVALHPYTGKPKNVVRIVKIIRRVMERNKGKALPIWLTELSWPAGVGQGQAGRRLLDHGLRPGEAAQRGPEAPVARGASSTSSSACTGTRGSRPRASPPARSTTAGCAGSGAAC